MNAKELNATARKIAESVKDKNPASLTYHDALSSGFKETGNPESDFVVFKVMVQSNSQQLRMVEQVEKTNAEQTKRIEAQKLPSETEIKK